jgi:phytoene synthase
VNSIDALSEVNAAGGIGAASIAAAKAHARRLVERSGTSFYWGMRLLPLPKREAMFAVYAFCREVDDIADGEMSAEEKHSALNAWRDEVEALYRGRPSRPTSIALLEPVASFDLPKAEFHLMIDGMAMDADDAKSPLSMIELERYCRAVAGTVGLLSMSVFGQRGHDLDRGGLALAEALQLTNILRVLHEDAERDRLYLPSELLVQYGLRDGTAREIIRNPEIKGVCRALASRATKAFELADRLLAKGDRKKLRPALIMMHVYRRVLEKLIVADWRNIEKRVRLGKFERLRIALRHAWF